METERVVGLGEVVVTDDPRLTLVVPGVGSCVIVVAYHRRAKVAGMAHIVLPSSQQFHTAAAKPLWFADIAVPHLLTQMAQRGAVRPRCAVIGGANMLQTMQRASRTAWRNIGAMNVAAVLGALHLKAEIVAQFVGGAAGWVVRLRVADGTVTVRSGQGEVHCIAL